MSGVDRLGACVAPRLGCGVVPKLGGGVVVTLGEDGPYSGCAEVPEGE